MIKSLKTTAIATLAFSLFSVGLAAETITKTFDVGEGGPAQTGYSGRLSSC